MTYTTNCRHQFKIDNNPYLIPPLLDFVQQSMITLKIGDQTLIRHASVALEEAVNNALYHGNLQLGDKHAFDARHAYREGNTHEIVEQRQHEDPYRSRKISVGIDLTKSKTQFVVRDSGDGFDFNSLPPNQKDSQISESNKRGVTLIKSFMSEVSFNDTGNEIRMTLNM